jgi:precorrin-2 dehydrogenase/sirohydrochlorin ferrochelatase
MEYFPIAINLHGKSCLVVGGGNVALRKTTKLVESGAVVTVVSPTVLDGFKSLGVGVEVVLRKFRLEDIKKEYALVVSATDDSNLNNDILSWCGRNNILCNSASEHTNNGCIFPSVSTCGGITVGITTNGVSPHISKAIREDIEKNVLPKYTQALQDS